MRWAAPALRFWSWLLNATVGYGFRTWRVLGWLTIVYFVGLFVLGPAWRVGGLLPTDDPPRVFALPACTLDVLVPLIDLGQREAWSPTPPHSPSPQKDHVGGGIPADTDSRYVDRLRRSV